MSDFLRAFGGLIAFMGLLSFAANDRMFNANAPHANPLDVDAWVRWTQVGCLFVGGTFYWLGVLLERRAQRRFNPRERFPNYVPIDQETPIPVPSGFYSAIYSMDQKNKENIEAAVTRMETQEILDNIT